MEVDGLLLISRTDGEQRWLETMIATVKYFTLRAQAPTAAKFRVPSMLDRMR